MAQQIINIGSNPDDQTGDTLRDGGDKINDNFTELYGIVGDRGWANYVDGTYTSGSPLTINNSRTKITIDGISSTDETALPEGSPSFWNTATNVIVAENVNDAYDIRFAFDAESSASNDWFTIEIDIGGGIGVIAETTRTFPKGIGVPHSFMWTVPVFAKSTFVANGASIYINTADSGDSIDVYNLRVFIKRDFTGGS